MGSHFWQVKMNLKNFSKSILFYERAMWAAMRTVPEATLYGCWFHWTQAVFRKVKALGLQSAYTVIITGSSLNNI